MLAHLRSQYGALRSLQYRPLVVASLQLAYLREGDASDTPVLVAVNIASELVSLSVPLAKDVARPGRIWRDLLNPSETFCERAEGLSIPLHPNYGRLLVCN